MNFITIDVRCEQHLTDILIAALFEIGFDSFQEIDSGFEGSCDEAKFNEEEVKSLLSPYDGVTYSIKEQEKVNWNEEWEKNYDPIVVGQRCIVRASFHDQRPEFEYEIIVTPKMSFGTGHHATTWQVLNYQLDLDHTGKHILDVGTGTGILAIMAKKRGAVALTATDIDDWCIENSAENFSLNHVEDVQLIQGQIDLVGKKDFDIVIANINKNVLLEQIGSYADRLKLNGELILSGFYEDDIADLVDKGEEFGLKKKKHTVKDRWAMLVLNKPSV